MGGGLHISAKPELPDVDIDGVNAALRHQGWGCLHISAKSELSEIDIGGVPPTPPSLSAARPEGGRVAGAAARWFVRERHPHPPGSIHQVVGVVGGVLRGGVLRGAVS